MSLGTSVQRGCLCGRLSYGDEPLRTGLRRHAEQSGALRSVRSAVRPQPGVSGRAVPNELPAFDGELRWRLHQHTDRPDELRRVRGGVRAGAVVLNRELPDSLRSRAYGVRELVRGHEHGRISLR